MRKFVIALLFYKKFELEEFFILRKSLFHVCQHPHAGI